MADESVRRQLVGMLSLGDIDLHASHELAGEIVEAEGRAPSYGEALQLANLVISWLKSVGS